MLKVQEKNTKSLIAFSHRGLRQHQIAVKKLIHEKYVLDNGLTVVLNPDHKIQADNVHLQYKVGSCRDILGKSGIAHLTEHLMFNHSENLHDNALGKKIDKLYSSINIKKDANES